MNHKPQYHLDPRQYPSGWLCWIYHEGRLIHTVRGFGYADVTCKALAWVAWVGGVVVEKEK